MIIQDHPDKAYNLDRDVFFPVDKMNTDTVNWLFTWGIQHLHLAPAMYKDCATALKEYLEYSLLYHFSFSKPIKQNSTVYKKIKNLDECYKHFTELGTELEEQSKSIGGVSENLLFQIQCLVGLSSVPTSSIVALSCKHKKGS